jgi:hypothetical protein
MLDVCFDVGDVPLDTSLEENEENLPGSETEISEISEGIATLAILSVYTTFH